ncbi:hypothetical protein CC1G_04192 [Coprinopsis cinerea okayama7|uniref:Uncharacterized protein n=1 Tax=Coprinopsis cinerea (strain Okayama-7 / 130 / ATCC MYA-4618 / FGSC 9003) TaxID=240176 RepID=A8NF70_COPC7|nr:hypothetical protein CC1G_04192 [Coprinopsis cinerea okayama7\|eukprot:XP_001833213.1 hypothetical protein CC1G_04192 [Coprinopsis cinerea okayama7\
MAPTHAAARHVLKRSIHASTKRLDRVAPPHPISHIRPIIYDDAPRATAPTLLRHPYSLNEFHDASRTPVDLELQFKLQRQQLDAFHQDFWLDNNVRYYAAKETALSNLPESASSLDKENALSEFNRHWYNQEKERVDAYTSEWRRRNFELIRLGAKVEFQKLASRISQALRST